MSDEEKQRFKSTHKESHKIGTGDAKKNEDSDERNRLNHKRKQSSKEEKQGFKTTIETKN